MITTTLLLIWGFLIFVPIWQSADYDRHFYWVIWSLLALVWVIPIFTGVNVKNNEGQYRGYVVAVEQNGAIFKGWNVYLKTELESSNEDIACIDRGNVQLIKDLIDLQERREVTTVIYEGVWQYKIGECPNSDWKITGIKS